MGAILLLESRAVSLLTAVHRPAWLQSTWAGFKPLLAACFPQDYRLSRAVGVFGQPIVQYILAHLLSHEQRLSHCKNSSYVRSGIATCPGC